MPILRGKPSQRPERFSLNMGSPLARGLVFAGLGQHAGTTLLYDESPSRNHGSRSLSLWDYSDTLKRFGMSYKSTGGWDPTAIVDPIGGKSAFTVSCFINFVSGQDWIGNWTVGSTYNCLFRFNGTAIQTYFVDSSGTTTSATYTNTITAGTLTHLVVRYSGGVVNLFKNGVVDATTLSMNSLRVSPSVWWGGKYFQSAMSLWDTIIHSRALEPAEIAALADPSNIDLRLGGVPLIQPVRRFWPVGPAAAGEAPTFKPAWAVNSNIVIG
jgi:hypothetical protein